MFVSTNKAHINALFCIDHILDPLIHPIPKFNKYLITKKYQVESLFRENIYMCLIIKSVTKSWFY